jgi:3-phenylpropionate/cinnamic acid dioxygenase small subunit
MPDPVQTLLVKDRIIDVLTTLFISTDNGDWAAVRACFAPSVHFDMSSMPGGEETQITPEKITAGWEEGLRSLQAVHHQIGNYQIEVGEDEATAFCYGTASHYKKNASGQNTRTFVGSYDLHLIQDGVTWRIDSFRFNLKYIDGNVDL